MVELGGTTLALPSKKETNTFYFTAYQELFNFRDWNYAATPINQTEILVRAAIDRKRFRGDPSAPPEKSHVFVRGYFDNYNIDRVTKHLTVLTIIVESIDVLCTRACAPLSTSVLSSISEDSEDWTSVDSEIDMYSPCPNLYVIQLFF